MNQLTDSDQNTSHIEILKLLPWYINKTVNDADRSLVEGHLRSCLSCRIELELQQHFADRVKDTEDMELIHKQPYLQLRARIRQSGNSPERSIQPTRSIQQAKQSGWFNDFSEWMLSPVSLGAASLIAIGMLMIFTVIEHNLYRPIVYKTLSLSGQGATHQNADIRIVFKADTSLEQISQIVGSVDARLIGEPGNAGVYRLQVNPDSLQSYESLQTIMLTLRDKTNVVFVEPDLKVSVPDLTD